MSTPCNPDAAGLAADETSTYGAERVASWTVVGTGPRTVTAWVVLPPVAWIVPVMTTADGLAPEL